jgi:hypothetical protein
MAQHIGGIEVVMGVVTAVEALAVLDVAALLSLPEPVTLIDEGTARVAAGGVDARHLSLTRFTRAMRVRPSSCPPRLTSTRVVVVAGRQPVAEPCTLSSRCARYRRKRRRRCRRCLGGLQPRAPVTAAPLALTTQSAAAQQRRRDRRNGSGVARRRLRWLMQRWYPMPPRRPHCQALPALTCRHATCHRHRGTRLLQIRAGFVSVTAARRPSHRRC